ncbi:MAG: substrate-binding domain-containing protein [Planctomycetes bacterium]|nr:substrate-binding domain-containing protein [Planctomycetota bacterium]
MLAAIAAAALIAGCGRKTSQARKTSGDGVRTLRFGLIAKSSTNPVFQAALNGARAKAAELNEKYAGKVRVVIDWQTPAKEDADRQADFIRQLVNKGADAIMISCSDAHAVTDAIDQAVDRGVAVMCFDSDAPQSKRFAFFGVDDIDTGKQVMKHLAAAMGGHGVVAILAGNQNAPNLQKRVQGVRLEAKNYPRITIKDVYYHPETPEDAANRVQQVMNANADITGWAMIGGWPLFTDALADNWNPNVKIVAVDALPAQLLYVAKGITPVLLAQRVFDWGYVSTDLTFRKVYLKEKVPERNISPLVPVTKANLADWARQLEKWGFDVDPKYLEKK